MRSSTWKEKRQVDLKPIGSTQVRSNNALLRGGLQTVQIVANDEEELVRSSRNPVFAREKNEKARAAQLISQSSGSQQQRCTTLTGKSSVSRNHILSLARGIVQRANEVRGVPTPEPSEGGSNRGEEINLQRKKLGQQHSTGTGQWQCNGEKVQIEKRNFRSVIGETMSIEEDEEMFGASASEEEEEEEVEERAISEDDKDITSQHSGRERETCFYDGVQTESSGGGSVDNLNEVGEVEGEDDEEEGEDDDEEGSGQSQSSDLATGSLAQFHIGLNVFQRELRGIFNGLQSSDENEGEDDGTNFEEDSMDESRENYTYVQHIAGLTKQEMQSLPTVRFTAAVVRTKFLQRFAGSTECSICLTSYVEKDVLRILPCEHRFHRTCIDHWLLKNVTCVVCKQDTLKR